MTNYPGAIDEFRNVENLPGVLYDAADTKTVFAEDTNNLASAVVAIENTLGVDPAASSPTVADRLNDVDDAIAAKENALGFTPENAANKSASPTLGTSNSLYPTQYAAKTYTDTKVSQYINNKITVSSTAPSSPAEGDIWIDIS